MIVSFGNRLTEDLYFDRTTRATKRFSAQLRGVARRKLLYLRDAEALQDLRVPLGNRLEALRGDLRGFHSIRINEQWRLIFRWNKGHAEVVAIVDYH